MKKNLHHIFYASLLGIGMVLISVYIGIWEIPDSFFYYVLGKHLYTGEIFPIAPYNYTKPQTLFGPLYGLIIAPLIDRPWPTAMFLIPLIQISMLFFISWLIYLMLKPDLKKPWPAIGAVLYICIPFNILYGTYMMSETLTQLLIALYLYFFRKSTIKKSLLYPSLMILIASLATLTRYVFQILIPISMLWLFIKLFTTYKSKMFSFINLKSYILHLIPAFLGLLLVVYWMWFNYKWNGKWILSTFTGRHIYDNVVTIGEFLPPDDHPTMKPFRERFPDIKPRDWMIGPWWEKQLAFNDGKLSEITVDKMMLDVSVAAILHQPIPYMLHVLWMMWTIPTTAPYSPPALIENLTSCTELACPDCPEKMCRFKWNWNLCVPARKNCEAQSLWAAFSQLNLLFYPLGAAVIFILSIIGAVIAIIRGKFFLKGVALLYLGLHGLHAATEWIEGRFLIPLYPMYAILVVLVIKVMYEQILLSITKKRKPITAIK